MDQQVTSNSNQPLLMPHLYKLLLFFVRKLEAVLGRQLLSLVYLPRIHTDLAHLNQVFVHLTTRL